MGRTKICTLNDYIASTDSPFLYKDDVNLSHVPEFLRDMVFQEVLKQYMKDRYGEYRLLAKYTIPAIDAANLIPIILDNQYIANAYMLNGLWESTQLDYNPIENYRMTEEGTDTNSGTDTTTHNLGKTSVQEIAGERTDTISYGSHDTTTTHEVSPESSGSYTAESRDRVSDGTHTDNATTGGQTTTVKGDAVTNTDALKHGHVLDHELTRSGNVGVTTSQQMIESERQIVNFNIYKVVADLILGTICCLVVTDF